MDLDEQARDEIGRTAFGPGARWILILSFVGSLAGFPVADAVYRWRAGDGPGVLIAEAGDIARAGFVEEGGFFARNAAVLREIEDFEDLVNSTNLLRETLVAPFQGLLYRYLWSGTVQVQVGQEGWLYFRDDARYVSGGFEGDAFLPAVEAIQDYRASLAAHGIELLVVPIPVKPVVEAGHLSSRIPPDHPALHPPAYRHWKAALAASGVPVLDPTDALLARRDAGEPVFLRADTHWRPETVALVAERIASHLEAIGIVRSAEMPESTRLAVGNRGDLWDLLATTEAYARTPPESVLIERLSSEPDREALGMPTVVVLGDSFANIYGTAGLNWGVRAGLPEQIELRLGLPVRRIAFNGDGINQPRKELNRLVSNGSLDLRNLKIVVWAFAVRDLALNDWNRISLE